MVKLRLRRIGKKKQPVYKIVAAHSESPRDGKFLEAIGTYNPRQEPPLIDIKETRLFYWLKKGAKATDKVLGLAKYKGLWLKWQLMKNGKDEAAIAAELEKWTVLQAERLRRQAEKKTHRKKKKKSSGEAAAAPAAPAPAEAPSA
ncbi:MAG: 30S ribosomal protein S16 [Bacteroidetes bacterium]|nr:MAG: 30S ribosomal protein S16 [Bacteroidota bacterium]